MLVPSPYNKKLIAMSPYMIIIFMISMWVGSVVFHSGNNAMLHPITNVKNAMSSGNMAVTPEEVEMEDEEEEFLENALNQDKVNPEDAKRSLTQEVDFSSIIGDDKWNREEAVPKIRLQIRQEVMEQRCQTADTSSEGFGVIKTNKIGIFFKQKASTCLVNKSGSSTWRAHLNQVNKGSSIYQQKDSRWKAFMAQPNLPEAMAQTSRIITVRHPLTRLVSAYRQRFENGKLPPLYVWNKRSAHNTKYFSHYWLPAIISNDVIPLEERTEIGMPVQHKLGKVYSRTLLKQVHQRLPKGFVLTFEMFLRHVVYTHQHDIIDAHWMPIQRLCAPCKLHYQYIVKLETMTEDVEYVFEELQIPSNASKKKNKERHTSSPWSDLTRYETVPLELKKEIIRLYWNDIYLFGYKLPPGFLDA